MILYIILYGLSLFFPCGNKGFYYYYYYYYYYSDILTPCDSIVNLGVNVQTNLKSDPHHTAIVSKASARCILILKSFLSRDPFVLARAFFVYVCQILEYCAPAWSPYFMQDIDLIKGVQCALREICTDIAI